MLADDEEALCHQEKIAVTKKLCTVAIEITCRDEYEAGVLFDDIVERFNAGQTLSIEPGPKPR